MSWAAALPNLLIGLREGLEAGLVVSILLAAVRQMDVVDHNGRDGRDDPTTTQAARARSVNMGRGTRVPHVPRVPRVVRVARGAQAAVWLGVLGAVATAGCFATILTRSTGALSSAGQDGVSGLLSVTAVALVTTMILWMRRTARSLSARLRGEVSRSATIGAGALTLTAFAAVGREGLETTLFLWSAVTASGSTAAPLIGAGVGILSSVLLCWLLYRRAVRINLGVFFDRTAFALIVIAAGLLAYGLGDLQSAGWVPGGQWVAVDLTGRVDPGAWWWSLVSGVTELAPRMTVLQVVAWAGYLAGVTVAFVHAGRSPTSDLSLIPADERAGARRLRTRARARTRSAVAELGASSARRWEQLVAGHAWLLAAAVLVIPAVVAATVVVALPAEATTTTQVSVTRTGCAPEWTSGRSGPQSFAVHDASDAAGEVDLDDAAGAVVAEVETIGPATTASMSATLGPGTYQFVCLMSGGTVRGAPVLVSGPAQTTTLAVKPVTLQELRGPNATYQAYAARELAAVSTDVADLRADVVADRLQQAKEEWLAAQLDWERVGASYDSFGDAGVAVDGLPGGDPGAVGSPTFTGLHRVEYGLYHGQAVSQLLPVVDRLRTDLSVVRNALATDDEAGDPTNVPIRVHEVLEDALRDHLSQLDDQGSGMAFAETYADTQATRTLLDLVAPLLATRAPALVPTVTRQLDAAQTALLATCSAGAWQPVAQVPTAARERVDATVDAALESLASEPDLLEVPPTH